MIQVYKSWEVIRVSLFLVYTEPRRWTGGLAVGRTLMIDLRTCVYCSSHQASLNCRGNMILAFLIFLMLTKRYRSWRIMFQLGFQLLMFLSLTTTLQVFSPTVQIYSAGFLTNHSPTLNSMVNWLLPLTFLSPWIILHQLSLISISLWSPAIKGPICVKSWLNKYPGTTASLFHVVHHSSAAGVSSMHPSW